MNGGEIRSLSDEDVDIYKDIGDFRLDRELAKLEESNKVQTENIARLTQKLKELTESNETLQNINEILTTNISILLKTAKAEIDRKQRVIDELRKKVESQNQRKLGGYEISDFQKSESLINCSVDFVEENCKKSEVEEGEIVQDVSGEKDHNSETGKRSDSSNRERRYRSDNYKTCRNSHERTRSRANDGRSSRQNSKSKESYSRHSSSSRSHHRSKSPDVRCHYDDKSRHYARSHNSYRSRSRKTEKSPCRKESTRRSRERRWPVSGKIVEKSRKEVLTDHIRKEKTGRTECATDNKSEIVKAKKDEKQREIQENSKTVKNLSTEESRLNRTVNTSYKKKTDLPPRESVLADLCDEPASTRTYPQISKNISDERIATTPQNDSEEENSDWQGDHGWNQWKSKEREPVQRAKTLYSYRMEAKFQQQQSSQEISSQENKESPDGKKDIVEKQAAENRNPEKTENTETDIQVNKILEEEVTEKNDNEDNNQMKNEATKTSSNVEITKEIESESNQKTTEVDPEQSFGDTLIKKLLQFQTAEENIGINVFSPLKNNYKLSKISPLKSVPKQHILEYYNLKPSTQHLNIMESEILDMSLSLPETPGKNFLNSFLPLSDAEDSLPKDDNSDGKCMEYNSNVENLKASYIKRREDGGMDDIIIARRSNKTKTKNCKTTKIHSTENNASAELKKSSQTTDDESSQGKSYKTRYQIRTRSKTENDKINSNEEEDSDRKQDGINKNTYGEEFRLEKDRRLTSTEEENLGSEPKRIKLETMKTVNEISTEGGTTIPEDITSYEVFMSVPDVTPGDVKTLVEEVGRVDEKSEDSAWNDGDSTINKTNSNEDETADPTVDKEKQSFFSTGNSADSSKFKVLRSYKMLSVNDDTDEDAFESDSSITGSEDYSDSGASALVDLL